MEKRTHRKCDDKYFDALKEETLSDALVTYKIGTIVQDYDLKHHIKLVQEELKDEHEAWRKEGVIGEFFDDSFGRIIEQIFLKHMGAKLLEDRE